VNFDRARYESLCAAGMPTGVGSRESACVMAALNLACGGDLTDSACVLPAAARFAMQLNDAPWSSPAARAAGLHDLGLALLGTADLDPQAFVTRLAEGTIRRVLPIALRAAKLDAAADRCESEGTRESARDAAVAADADRAATAATATAATHAAAFAYAAFAAAYACAYAYAATAAADAAHAAAATDGGGDHVLRVSAQLATEILTEMRGAL
jgi:hypothetical protein